MPTSCGRQGLGSEPRPVCDAVCCDLGYAFSLNILKITLFSIVCVCKSVYRYVYVLTKRN